MDIKVETSIKKGGEITGLTVIVGKKKHKVAGVGPSLLVSVDGKDVVGLPFDQQSGATEHINNLMKSIKKNPAPHLKSPEHLFAFESSAGAYALTLAVEPRAEAHRLYEKAEEIARAFRAKMNNQK